MEKYGFLVKFYVYLELNEFSDVFSSEFKYFVFV